MPTDDDLTTLLRAGFDAATEDLAASPLLATDVRRRHRVAQRRRYAFAAALPATAAVGTFLVVSGGRTPSAAPMAGTSPTRSQATVRPVSYQIVLDTSSPSTACADAVGSIGRTVDPRTVWQWTANGQCRAAAVAFVDQLPASAGPITLGRLTGLHGTTDSANGTRTVYAPLAAGESSAHPAGGWSAVTVAADFPEGELAAFFVPTSR